MANATGSAITLVPGAPMDDNVAEVAAGIADTDGIVLEKTVIPNGESRRVPVLARGPAVINVDALPTTDYAGSAINMTNFQTALEAMEDIVVREEPDTITTRTT